MSQFKEAAKSEGKRFCSVWIQMNVGEEGPTLVLDGQQVLGDHRKQNAERKKKTL